MKSNLRSAQHFIKVPHATVPPVGMQWQKSRVSKDSEKFRYMAARSLRAARATSDAAFRQTCFGVAAIYKRLALEDEILKGERRRSGPRKMEQLLPQAPLRSDDIQIVCEPRDSEAVSDAVTISEPNSITNSGPDAIASQGDEEMPRTSAKQI